jgi:hypothetical protein
VTTPHMTMVSGVPFDRFDAPASLTELPHAALASYSSMMADHAAQFALSFDRYFDPLAPGSREARLVQIVWAASPARLASLSDRDRWQQADATRDEQDEYCEWTIARQPDGKLTRVTFTTEVPDYWSHIADADPDLLLDLYHRVVSPDVTIDDLFRDMAYQRNNKWNNATSEGIAHLRQANNTLLAAIDLAATATVQRVGPDGRRIEDRRQLVVCGQLGDSSRNSDPQIADAVNDAVFAGSAVSLANPLGLYLDGIQTPSFVAPDGADVATLWTVERGDPGHAVRARFEVPEGAGYVLGDLTVDGRPLEFGTQVADKVRVRIDALLAPSTTQLVTKQCEALPPSRFAPS